MSPLPNTYLLWRSAATIPVRRAVQRRLVETGLKTRSDVAVASGSVRAERFHGSALKYDLEMLPLAAEPELHDVLGTRDALVGWRVPVEEQDQYKPPKIVVQELFRTKSKERRAYRDTRDAPKVLGRVADLRKLLHTDTGQVNCPVFKAMLDWLGERFRVPAYT